MFSIRKRYKIQVHYRINKEISTTDIDTLRITRTQEQVQSTSSAISSIINLTPVEEIQKQIDRYFPKRWETLWIHNFFYDHPHVFNDLIRVIHTHRVNNSISWWHIPDEYVPDIYQAFLFRNRKNDIGNDIPLFVKEVCKNQKFIEFASKQPSILDMNSYEFAQIGDKPRKKNIRRLIVSGLVSNISWCTDSNIDVYFLQTKDRIFHYLNEIFWVDVSGIYYVRSIDQLTEVLSELFRTGKWNDRKKAWKVIQAFHAWGDVNTIEEDFADTMERCKEIPKKLLKAWFILQWAITTSRHPQWAVIHSWSYTFNDQPIEVSWRVKSVKSLLKKLWETGEYIRASVVRDALGMWIGYDDTTSQDMIIDTIRAWSGMLAHRGYILKNKWELDDENTLQKVITGTRKQPLFVEHKPWGDPKMKNASQSGFMSLWTGNKNQAIGCEIQYSKRSAKQWKEKEDPIYKFRWAINALMRWSYQATPKEIFDAITREIQVSDIPKLSDPDTGVSLGLSTYNDIMQYLIETKKILLPFFWKVWDKHILLFTTWVYKEEFKKRWNMTYLEKKERRRYQDMNTVIQGLQHTH